MADPVTALVAVSVVGAGAKAFFQTEAADSKTEALNLQAQEARLQHTQKVISNYDMTKKILDRQIAQATTRGVSLNSSSLEAIERDTFNTGVKENKNIDIEDSLFQRNIKLEKRNVKDTLYAQLFGDVEEVGMSFASIGSKMPTSA